MVCLKIEVTDVDSAIGPQSMFLKQFKKMCPNVSQLFHFRKTRRIHVVSNSSIPDYEQHIVANALLAVGGEPLPLSDDHHRELSEKFPEIREAVQRSQSIALNAAKGEDIVLNPEKESWGVGPLIGIKGPTARRRQEIINLMFILGVFPKTYERIVRQSPEVDAILNSAAAQQGFLGQSFQQSTASTTVMEPSPIVTEVLPMRGSGDLAANAAVEEVTGHEAASDAAAPAAAKALSANAKSFMPTTGPAPPAVLADAASFSAAAQQSRSLRSSNGGAVPSFNAAATALAPAAIPYVQMAMGMPMGMPFMSPGFMPMAMPTVAVGHQAVPGGVQVYIPPLVSSAPPPASPASAAVVGNQAASGPSNDAAESDNLAKLLTSLKEASARPAEVVVSENVFSDAGAHSEWVSESSPPTARYHNEEHQSAEPPTAIASERVRDVVGAQQSRVTKQSPAKLIPQSTVGRAKELLLAALGSSTILQEMLPRLQEAESIAQLHVALEPLFGIAPMMFREKVAPILLEASYLEATERDSAPLTICLDPESILARLASESVEAVCHIIKPLLGLPTGSTLSVLSPTIDTNEDGQSSIHCTVWHRLNTGRAFPSAVTVEEEDFTFKSLAKWHHAVDTFTGRVVVLRRTEKTTGKKGNYVATVAAVSPGVLEQFAAALNPATSPFFCGAAVNDKHCGECRSLVFAKGDLCLIHAIAVPSAEGRKADLVCGALISPTATCMIPVSHKKTYCRFHAGPESSPQIAELESNLQRVVAETTDDET